jgi:acetyltransferase-like isoleucine patch superfamily enzyme
MGARTALLAEILVRPVPETLTLYPPFYCDYGLNLEFGERVFVNQNCSFMTSAASPSATAP